MLLYFVILERSRVSVVEAAVLTDVVLVRVATVLPPRGLRPEVPAAWNAVIAVEARVPEVLVKRMLRREFPVAEAAVVVHD